MTAASDKIMSLWVLMIYWVIMSLWVISSMNNASSQSFKSNNQQGSIITAVHQHTINSAAMIRAFMLALCGLLLWLSVSIEVNEFDLYHGYLFSVRFQLQRFYPNTWLLWFWQRMDLEMIVTQYQLSSHGKLGKVDKVIYSFIGFTFSMSSVHKYSISIHSSTSVTYQSRDWYVNKTDLFQTSLWRLIGT